MKIEIDNFNGPLFLDKESQLEVDWLLKEDIKFIASICIKRFHRYVFDIIYNQKTQLLKKFKYRCIAKALHIITYKLWRHWRTFYMIGCERYNMRPNRQYTRLDAWRKII